MFPLCLLFFRTICRIFLWTPSKQNFSVSRYTRRGLLLARWFIFHLCSVIDTVQSNATTRCNGQTHCCTCRKLGERENERENERERVRERASNGLNDHTLRRRRNWPHLCILKVQLLKNLHSSGFFSHFTSPLYLYTHSPPPCQSRLAAAGPFTPNLPTSPCDSFHGNISKAQNVVADSVISVFEVSDSSRVSRDSCVHTSQVQPSDVCTVGWLAHQPGTSLHICCRLLHPFSASEKNSPSWAALYNKRSTKL